MYKSLFIFFFLIGSAHADNTDFKFLNYKKNYKQTVINQEDLYSFFYDSKSKKCKLTKNTLAIELFDKRFNKKAPRVRTYRCAAWIKEQYSSCKAEATPIVSSVALSYGKYEQTNLLIGFNVLHPNLSGRVDVRCIK